MAEDQVARRQAALANQKIDSHEDHCSERWKEARDEIKTLHTRVSETRGAMDQGIKDVTKEVRDGHKRITGWLIAGQASAILLLLATLLAMATKS